jgi:hypothetical protein
VLRVDIAGVAALAVHAQLSTPCIELGHLGCRCGRLGCFRAVGRVLVGYFSSGGVGTYLLGWIGKNVKQCHVTSQTRNFDKSKPIRKVLLHFYYTFHYIFLLDILLSLTIVFLVFYYTFLLHTIYQL